MDLCVHEQDGLLLLAHVYLLLQVIGDGERVNVLQALRDHAELAHRGAGEQAAEILDGLIAVGANAEITVGAAREAGLIKVEAVSDAEAAVRILRDWLRSDDAVLLKASRAARLEQLEDLI